MAKNKSTDTGADANALTDVVSDTPPLPPVAEQAPADASGGGALAKREPDPAPRPHPMQPLLDRADRLLARIPLGNVSEREAASILRDLIASAIGY